MRGRVVEAERGMLLMPEEEDCESERRDSLGAASDEEMDSRMAGRVDLVGIEPVAVFAVPAEGNPTPKTPSPEAGLPCSMPAKGLAKSKSKSCLDDALPFCCLLWRLSSGSCCSAVRGDCGRGEDGLVATTGAGGWCVNMLALRARAQLCSSCGLRPKCGKSGCFELVRSLRRSWR